MNVPIRKFLKKMSKTDGGEHGDEKYMKGPWCQKQDVLVVCYCIVSKKTIC